MKEKAETILQRARQFFFHDIWAVDPSSASPLYRLVARIVRIGHLVIKGFGDDELTVHASSLTFASSMSLVPLLAIIFSLLKAFGAGKDRIAELIAWKTQMPIEFQGFVDHVVEVVNNTNFAAMGWVGVGFLLLTSTLVLSSMERSFNRVWGISAPRSTIRRITNYISILVVVPILIGIAGTIGTALTHETVLQHLGSLGFIYDILLKLSPVLSACVAFGFLYAILPNTRVRWSSALIAGLVGGLLWLGWQELYITLQFGVARYNAIYGTFAVIPIFLAWMHIGWVIILLGAEVSFAVQNEATFHLERAGEKANIKARAAISLAVVSRVAEAMSGTSLPFDCESFAKQKCVPVRLLNEVISQLVDAGWLAEVADRPENYVLLRAPASILVRDILKTVMDEGVSLETLGLDHLGLPVEHILAKYGEALSAGLGTQTIQDMIKSSVNPEPSQDSV